MSISGYRRLVAVLSVVCFVLLAVACKLFWDWISLRVQVAFASEQTEIFEAQGRSALTADPVGAALELQYILGYYPSGTKQVIGSRLDQIVERQRTQAAKDIVAYLRSKTGEDLGDHPEKWIQKYAKH